jgi:hypothetical protein
MLAATAVSILQGRGHLIAADKVLEFGTRLAAETFLQPASARRLTNGHFRRLIVQMRFASVPRSIFSPMVIVPFPTL